MVRPRFRGQQGPAKKPGAEPDASTGGTTSAQEPPPLRGGLQPDGREPVRVLPGRGRSVAADVAALLKDFEGRLHHSTATFENSSGPATRNQRLPRIGAFAALRDAYIDQGFSAVLDHHKSEPPRDIFHFTCGICWRLHLQTPGLLRRAGLLFIVYLLYYSQPAEQYDIPVDVIVLEALADIRRECCRKEVLLECPKILQRLCIIRALSPGIRATYRNMYFDRHGRLGERCEKSDEEAEEHHELDPERDVQVKRLQVSLAEAPGGPAARYPNLPAASSSSAIVSASAGDAESIELEDLLRQARAFAEHPDSGSQAAKALGGIGSLATRFVEQTPPEPRDIPVAGNAQGSEARPLRRRKTKRRRRLTLSPEPASSEQAQHHDPKGYAARIGMAEFQLRRARQAEQPGQPSQPLQPLQPPQRPSTTEGSRAGTASPTRPDQQPEMHKPSEMPSIVGGSEAGTGRDSGTAADVSPMQSSSPQTKVAKVVAGTASAFGATTSVDVAGSAASGDTAGVRGKAADEAELAELWGDISAIFDDPIEGEEVQAEQAAGTALSSSAKAPMDIESQAEEHSSDDHDSVLSDEVVIP